MKKKYTSFRPRIRSRHPSHSKLRSKNGGLLPLLPFKSVIRFGSSTELRDTVEKGGTRVELNSAKAIKNSANKLLMKQCFTENDVETADWWTFDGDVFFKNGSVEIDEGQEDELTDDFNSLPYPIISKNIYGSRGTGNKKHDSRESLEAWMEGKNLNNYIFERYHNYVREYRLHVSEEGYFYSCRKMLKRDTPEEHKWYRNDDHCVWVMEENELFDKPVNWEDIEKECVKALKSVGLDFGAIDLRIQSSTNAGGEPREYPEFKIIEINSAPSFGEVTLEKYKEELPKILKNKANKSYE